MSREEQIDQLISTKIQHYSPEPDQESWDKVRAQLPANKRTRKLGFPIAAVLLLLIIPASLMLFTPDRNARKIVRKHQNFSARKVSRNIPTKAISKQKTENVPDQSVAGQSAGATKQVANHQLEEIKGKTAAFTPPTVQQRMLIAPIPSEAIAGELSIEEEPDQLFARETDQVSKPSENGIGTFLKEETSKLINSKKTVEESDTRFREVYTADFRLFKIKRSTTTRK